MKNLGRDNSRMLFLFENYGADNKMSKMIVR